MAQADIRENPIRELLDLVRCQFAGLKRGFLLERTIRLRDRVGIQPIPTRGDACSDGSSR